MKEYCREDKIRTISRDELRQKLEGKEYFFLVETLPQEFYRKGHLAEAINLPPDKLRELAPTLLPDKNAEVIVYCAKPT